MSTLGEYTQRDLVWRQPEALKRRYELRADDQVVATLEFERSSLALAKAPSGGWTFKREGFWRPRISIRRPGSDEDDATFQPHFGGGGELHLDDGGRYQLHQSSLWHSEWVWEQDSKTLIRYKAHQGLLKGEAAVQIESGVASDSNLDLLVPLGWYLILLHTRDIAATSTVSSTTAVRI